MAEEGYTEGKEWRLELEEVVGRPEEGLALALKVVAPKGSIQWSCGAGSGSRGYQRRVPKSAKRRRSVVMGVQCM